MPLWRHLSDTAEVARCLWDEWLPPPVRELIRGDGSADVGRRLVVWLAAAHDLGKASPAFAVQVGQCAERMRGVGLDFSPLTGSLKRAPHADLSHLIVRRWLEGEGFTADQADAFAIVPGGHHGVAPARLDIEQAASPRQCGGSAWRVVQEELAGWVASNAGIREHLLELQRHPIRPTAQALITAVVILADWMASDAARFPLQDTRSTRERVAAAWPQFGLVEPWSSVAGGASAQELFDSRFSRARTRPIRPIQREAAALAGQCDEPELMIIEAPMGEGKTEAALLAADVLASRFGSGGVMVALPTMATSDAMFDRVRAWVETVSAGPQPMFLAHSKAALNPAFVNLMRIQPRDVDVTETELSHGDTCGEGVAVALEWLTGRKKGVLANFVVGTIDQVLMGALRTRHLVLRHLALVTKVVVIDEVHAADSYMAVYLSRALHWLGAYGVPTILLSATLPSMRRSEFVAAYQGGIAKRADETSNGGSPFGSRASRPPTDERRLTPSAITPPAYPVITSGGRLGVRSLGVPASGSSRALAVEFLDDDDAVLVSTLRRCLARGGVVGIVRNTVNRAQAAAALLRGEFGDAAVTLAHSRFLAIDRMRRERALRAELGPAESAQRRPGPRIIVGTQVLEQSLDIDFDLLISDLAPLDLVLQRVGRLHRHPRPPAQRGSMIEPRCLLTGVDWSTDPPVPDRGSVFVYGCSPLLRSIATLQEHLRRSDGLVRLPEDIAPLVERAYGAEPPVPPSWEQVFAASERDAFDSAVSRRSAAQTYLLPEVPRQLLFGWSAGNVGDAESPQGRATVRDGDDSLEVLVAQRVGDRWFVLPDVDAHGGVELSTHAPPEWAVARAVAQCSLRLPRLLCLPWRLSSVIRDLESNGVAAWQRSPWLRGELVLGLDENMSAELAGVPLRYTQQDGLIVGTQSESLRGPSQPAEPPFIPARAGNTRQSSAGNAN